MARRKAAQRKQVSVAQRCCHPWSWPERWTVAWPWPPAAAQLPRQQRRPQHTSQPREATVADPASHRQPHQRLALAPHSPWHSSAGTCQAALSFSWVWQRSARHPRLLGPCRAPLVQRCHGETDVLRTNTPRDGHARRPAARRGRPARARAAAAPRAHRARVSRGSLFLLLVAPLARAANLAHFDPVRGCAAGLQYRA